MTEKISMIELFSGIGAQERALRQLKIPYEVKHTCDCDANATLSYAAMRWNLEEEIKTFNFPSQKQMIEELQAKNLGYDFQKEKYSITNRTPLDKLKQYYLADKLSKNLGDISKVERLPYVDFWTYSYPCTDLSVAGKGEGMVNKCDKCEHTWAIDFESPQTNNICPECGNIDIKSTRSGLLGQVQRLLTVAHDEGTLPKYLLLENVKNLVGKKFKPQFDAWINWLDLIGYNTYYKVLNAKHYGVPQNRERIFAISIRKDVDTSGYTFPEQIELETRLKDVLEKNVDEKYYLPDDRIEKILNTTFLKEKMETQFEAESASDEDVMPVRLGGLYDDENSRHQAGAIWDKDAISPTLDTMQGGNRMPLILDEEVWEEYKDTGYYISNTGLVKCKDGSIKSLREDRYGYYRVNLYANGEEATRTVHQLVAETFIPNPLNLPQINHIDGNKKNNHVTNLEWCTAQENMDHKKNVLHNSGSKPHQLRGVYYNKEKNKWEAQIKINDKSTYLGRFNSKEDAYECYRKKFIELNGYEPWGTSTSSDEIKVVGNYMPSNHDASRVVDIDGIAPTVKENHGTVTAIAEPFIVASRGRNPDNPSDRTVGAPTEQRLEPNFSGCSNTLTSVQKDNYVCEPIIEKNLWTETQKKMITEDGNIKRYINSDVVDKFEVGDCADISFPNGYNKANRVFEGYSPAINGTTTQSSFIVKEPIIYDDYNSRISADQDAINTLTCNCGASAERNGVKIIEPVIIEDFYQSREPRIYTDTAPTIRSERTGLKAADGEIEYPCSTRGKQVASAIRASIYKQGARNLEENVVNGLGYEGVIEEEEPKIKWRIRKLTDKECWRLMNFSDEDNDRASVYVAASSLYKQAGNSIVVACLVALMSSLFIDDGHKSDVWTQYMLHFED